MPRSAALGSFRKTASIRPTASLGSFRKTAPARPARCLVGFVSFDPSSVPRSPHFLQIRPRCQVPNCRHSSIQSQFPKDVMNSRPPSRLGFVRAFFVSGARFDLYPHLPFAPLARPAAVDSVARVRCRLTSSGPWVRFAKRPPSRPPPRWVRFAERYPLRLARCRLGFVSQSGLHPARRLGFVSQNGLDPAPRLVGFASQNGIRSASPAASLGSFRLILCPSPVLRTSSKSGHVVKCPIVGILRSNLNSQKMLYISGHLPPSGSFAHFSCSAHDSTPILICRLLFSPDPLRLLRSRAFDVDRRTLGSFRNTVPYSATRLAVFVLAAPSSILYQQSSALRPPFNMICKSPRRVA